MLHCPHSTEGLTKGKTGYLVLPIVTLETYSMSHPAPFGSTGWYIPSPKELHMLCYKDTDNIWDSMGTDSKQYLNEIIDQISSDNLSEDYYWTSMESSVNSDMAIACKFNNANLSYQHKRNEYDKLFCRYVCAF